MREGDGEGETLIPLSFSAGEAFILLSKNGKCKVRKQVYLLQGGGKGRERRPLFCVV